MKKFACFVMIMCASLLMWNCNGGKDGTKVGTAQTEDGSATVENPLKVGMPAVEKFVRILTDEGTKVFREADTKSPWRVTWIENLESDMAVIVDRWSNDDVPEEYDFSIEDALACAGDVLAVLGEEGDFYKVSIYNERCNMEYGYVKKENTTEVTPEALTAEDVEKFANAYDWIHVRILKDGKYKGLVLRSVMDELRGESFEVGVMLDGCLAFPELNSDLIDYSSNVDELTFMEGKQEEDQPLLYFKYPKSMAFMTEYDYLQGFNPEKLTDEQIDKIVQDMLQRKSELVKYEFLIPMTEDGIRTYWMRSK